MLKGKLGRGLAMLLSTTLILGTVFWGNVDYAKATEAGEGDIQFSYTGADGTVEYSINDKTHWTSVSGSEIISKSTLTSASKIYIKVTAAADKQIDSHEGQQIIRINESDTIITAYDDLKNGDYYFDYNSSNKYKLTIGFENNNSGSGDGSYVTGKYKVTIQDANNIGTSVTLTFKDASGNITGTVSGITENVAETAIPTETTKVTIAMSSTSLQNARLRWGNTQETELDLIDGIRQDGNITCDINIANGYELLFSTLNGASLFTLNGSILT